MYIYMYIYIYTWVFSRDTMRRQEVPMSFHFKNDHASSWLPSTSGSRPPRLGTDQGGNETARGGGEG